MRNLLMLAAAGLLLGACSLNPQSKAGMTIASVELCESRIAAGTLYPCKWTLSDGKEKDDVELSVKLADGSLVTYHAKGVRAFEALKIRAAVEATVAKTVGEVGPGVVEAITQAVLGAVVP